MIAQPFGPRRAATRACRMSARASVLLAAGLLATAPLATETTDPLAERPVRDMIIKLENRLTAVLGAVRLRNRGI